MQIKTTITTNISVKEQIAIRFKSLKRETYWFLTALTIMLVFIIFINLTIFILLLFITHLIFTYLFYHKKFFHKTKDIGELVINSDIISITINKQEESFKVENMKSLRIYFNGYEGLILDTKRAVDGDLNIISFEFSDKKYLYQFKLRSKEEYEVLIQVLKAWYDKKINFKEFYFEQRSFLFDPSINFQEIQNLKNKYHIDWI